MRFAVAKAGRESRRPQRHPETARGNRLVVGSAQTVDRTPNALLAGPCERRSVVARAELSSLDRRNEDSLVDEGRQT